MQLLEQRITRLEQRIDSLTRSNNSTPFESNSSSPVSYGTATKEFRRCQAITRKGTQCKRAAKGSGYCWQHEK